MSSAGDEVEAAKEWLGGEVGSGRVLRADLQEIMVSGFEHDPQIWTMDDVKALDETSSGEWAEAKALWMAFLEDSAEVDASHELNKSMRVLFGQWLTKRAATTTEDGTGDVYIPSSQEKADLEAQGMTEPSQLRYFELAMHIGRLGGEKEIAGGEYGIWPSPMVGAAKAYKIGAPTLQTLLKQGYKEKSDALVAKHLQKVAKAMGASNEPFYQRLSSNVYRFWMRACENISDPVARLCYVEDMRYGAYVGRGLPVLYDPEVGQRAMSKAAQLAAPKIEDIKSNEKSQAMEKSIQELSKGQESIAKSLSSIAGELAKLKAKGNDDKDHDNCFKCGKPGHKAKFCPNNSKDGGSES